MNELIYCGTIPMINQQNDNYDSFVPTSEEIVFTWKVKKLELFIIREAKNQDLYRIVQRYDKFEVFSYYLDSLKFMANIFKVYGDSLFVENGTKSFIKHLLSWGSSSAQLNLHETV